MFAAAAAGLGAALALICWELAAQARAAYRPVPSHGVHVPARGAGHTTRR